MQYSLLASLSLISIVLAAAPASAQQKTGPAESVLGVISELKNPADPNSGVVVAYTWPLSPARQMGIQIGDEIRTVNDIVATNPRSFGELVRTENINAKVRFQIRRAGQDMKVEGRMGSREKFMKAYQEMVRKDLTGKPLPPLPGAVWWNPASKKWEEKPDALAELKGKVLILMSFDDCDQCREKRYQELSRMQAVHAQKASPVAFAGIFYDDRAGKTGKEANLKSATDLITLVPAPPSVPLAVAFYPGDKPTPNDRDTQVLLSNHGSAIIDPNGNVEYIQILGLPEVEFGSALQKALQKVAGKAAEGAAPAREKDDEKKPDAKKAQEGQPSTK